MPTTGFCAAVDYVLFQVRIKVEYRFYFLSETGTPLFSNVNVGEFHAKPPKGGHSWGLRNIPKQKVLDLPLVFFFAYCFLLFGGGGISLRLSY